MKKYISLLLIFYSTIVFSQNVVVELSIEWKKENNQNTHIVDQNIDSIIPYLKITYKNFSDRDLYFLKYSVVNSIQNPKIVSFCPSNINTKIYQDTIERKKNVAIIRLEDFYISAYNDKLSKYYYNCINTMHLLEKYYFTNWIKDRYGDQYKSKYYLNPEQIFKEYLSLLKEPISEIHSINKEIIKNELNEYFLFLRKDEVFSEYVNLIGFKKIGGKYTFEINNEKRTNYLIIRDKKTKNIDIAGTHMKKHFFPGKIDQFSLYTGVLLSNKVVIEFP